MSTHAESSKFYEPIVPSDQIQYREYKLLLKPDRFPDEKSFHKFWKLAHHAAKSIGIKISKIGEALKAHQREVVFYDTPHFKLYNHGFILRKRTFYHHGAPDARHELVIKFRHPDKKVALAVDPRPLLPCEYTLKFKEEILLPKDGTLGMRLVYSHNCELDTPNIILTQRFETTADAFPALKHIDANPKAALSVVNNVSIGEYLVDLGMLDFGHGLEAKADAGGMAGARDQRAVGGGVRLPVEVRESRSSAAQAARAFRVLLHGPAVAGHRLGAAWNNQNRPHLRIRTFKRQARRVNPTSIRAC